MIQKLFGLGAVSFILKKKELIKSIQKLYYYYSNYFLEIDPTTDPCDGKYAKEEKPVSDQKCRDKCLQEMCKDIV